MSSLPPSGSVTRAPTPARFICSHRLRIADGERRDVFQPGVEDRASTAIVSMVPPEAQLS